MAEIFFVMFNPHGLGCGGVRFTGLFGLRPQRPAYNKV